ncbi:S41 family peptidase [Pedobacter lusitanus]|nr:S41 family peptidase [Pedobacter lusitanus]
MKLKFLLVFFVSSGLISSLTYGQEKETLLLRTPSISKNHIAFAYAGDIWVANRDGSSPRRLTVNPAVEQNPVISPDERNIAFTGNYDGNQDVYVVPIEGGTPKRLTYHPAGDVIRGWVNNNEVYFTSTRSFEYGFNSRLYRVGLKGGEAKVLPMPEATQGSASPDGRQWAYIKNLDPTERPGVAFKRYRGGGMPDIWLFDMKTNEIEVLPGAKSNNIKPQWIGNKIFFISDRNHTQNIFSYDIQTKKTEQITQYKEYDVKWLSGDGTSLAYEQAGSIYTMDPLTGQSVKLKILIEADIPYKRARYESIDRDITDMDLSPTGKRAVFQSRGEIFSIPKEKGDIRNISKSPGSHERSPGWSPNGKWISYISDVKGNYQLVLRDQLAEKEPLYFKLGESGFYFGLTWSPDSKKLFYSDSHLNLFYIDIDSRKIVTVANDKLGSTTNRTSNYFYSSWSADSQWISYVKTLENGNTAVFIYNLASGKSSQVTDGIGNAGPTVFSRDGKYLFFTASTNIGLGNSGLHMTAYDRPNTSSVYAVLLSKQTPSLFTTESDEEAEGKAEQKKERIENAKRDKNKKAELKDTVVNVKVDLDGISNRIVALPLPAGDYGDLNGNISGKLLYVNGGGIKAFDLKTLKDSMLIPGTVFYTVSYDGKSILYRAGSDYFIVDASHKPQPDEGKLNLGSGKIYIDPVAEWKQTFDEVWRLEKDYFYAENMHGNDWDAVKKKYEKFLPFVGHREDLTYLFGEMLGELVVGHSYIRGGDQPKAANVDVGMLGADYETDHGYYKVSKIFSALSWNPNLKAPLMEPGLNIENGIYILAVNGEPVTTDRSIYSYFENTTGKQVRLKINTKPGLDGAKEVTVVPISFAAETDLRRMNWMEAKRKKVDELSGGKIAYIYMMDTGSDGYTSFNRYYFSQMDKKALLIDERNNRGGSVADYVVDLLNRDIISYWGIRDGKSFTTPGNGIFGPKAMIINEYAGSGGDMMPYMFHYKKLGKLVGRTTMGILVGISGYPSLIDGGTVTAPNFGIYGTDGKWIIENQGVAPDVFVEQKPKDLIEGRDPQLETTVKILLEEMKTYPYKEVKKPADPDRAHQ